MKSKTNQPQNIAQLEKLLKRSGETSAGDPGEPRPNLKNLSRGSKWLIPLKI